MALGFISKYLVFRLDRFNVFRKFLQVVFIQIVEQEGPKCVDFGLTATAIGHLSPQKGDRWVTNHKESCTANPADYSM
jgi:hypothetical protein